MCCHVSILYCHASIPSSRGACANCGDFFGFKCCASKENNVDWTRTYDVPKNLNPLAVHVDDGESQQPQVKIPLPYTNASSNQSFNYTYGDVGVSHSSPSNNRPEMSEPLKDIN